MLRPRRLVVSLAALGGVLVQAFASVACGPTLLEQLTPTPGVPTTSQYATALVMPGGTTSTTFTLTVTDVVGVTLASVVSNATGNVLAPSLNLTLGTQTSASTCSPTATQSVQPALSAQITKTLTAGTYCVAVDGSGLSEPSVVTVRINSSTTAPTTTASPTAADVFNSTVGPKGVATHELPIAFNGVTTVTVVSAGTTDTIGLGFGVWDGQVCRLNTQLSTAAAVNPSISTTVDPGNYCVTVTDVEGLVAPILFTITTIHP